VRFTKSWWSAGEVEMYVRWLSDAAKQVLANNPAVDTTEALDTGLTAFTAKNPASAHGLTRDVEFEPVARMLRTVAEQPTSKVNLSRDGAVLTLEFYVPLERTLFVTKDGQRQAAKMSKSYGNTIPIFAEGKPLKKAVMGIETRLIDLADPMDPKEDLVLALYRLFASDAEVQDLEAKYRAGGFGFGRAKQLLLDKIDSHFAPARERKRQLEQDPGYVEGVLAEGAKKARAVARRTLDAARAACGLA
jgi:hypothetical protein